MNSVRAVLWTLILVLALGLNSAGQAKSNSSQMPGGTGNSAVMPHGHGRYDAQVQREVTVELKKYKWADTVRVSVEDGMVSLQGRVPLYADKLTAYDKIHNKPHVSGVRNAISVAGPNLPDKELAAKLADKLRYDRAGYGMVFNNLNVGVKNGVVTLQGEVHDPVAAQTALAVVAYTAGVKDLIDEVKVLPLSGFDDETRLAVARAIYGNPALERYSLDPQRPIRIVVENGHVTLWGVVDRQADKIIAEQAANTVPNVFSVQDNLVVANQHPEGAGK
jgi:osmotically-inducible protein OsmY